MSWKSYAEWNPEVYTNHYGEPISEDTHASEGAARGVCFMLERDGFGGDGQYFPVRTWVEEIPA